MEWLCFFIAVVRRGSSLAAHLQISNARDIFWHRSMTGSQRVSRLRTCAPREPRSTRSRSVFHNAYLPATAMRAKFALALPSGSKPRGDSQVATDRRSRAVAHEASGQRRTTCPMRETAKSRFALEALDRYN
jgi:hypothetical protein